MKAHVFVIAALCCVLLFGSNDLSLAQRPCGQWTPDLFPLSSVDGSLYTLAALDDGSGLALYGGGRFRAAGSDAAANGIARWSGGSWVPVGPGIASFRTPTVRAMVAFDDGAGRAIYAAGSFDAMGAAQANSIARWNGTQWSSLGEGVSGT